LLIFLLTALPVTFVVWWGADWRAYDGPEKHHIIELPLFVQIAISGCWGFAAGWTAIAAALAASTIWWALRRRK
jgi:hypothetical protein